MSSVDQGSLLFYSASNPIDTDNLPCANIVHGRQKVQDLSA